MTDPRLDKKFCKNTGKYHRWKFKTHGNQSFANECGDCGMKASELDPEIEKNKKEAEAREKDDIASNKKAEDQALKAQVEKVNG